MSMLPPLPSPPPASQATDGPSYPAIAFQIAGHWLALPQAALLRVVHQSALNQTVPPATLAYLGNQPLALLNLEILLARLSLGQTTPDSGGQAVSPADPPFLVIAALETTMIGIPIHQLPILLNLPLQATHSLPPNYYSAIQGIASHGVIVPELGAVLLLNLQAAMSQSI